MSTQDPEHRIGKGMIFAGWIVVLGLLTLYFSQWQNQRQNPNAVPMSSAAEGVNEVVLKRNFQHHYIASGLINGHPVVFLVDTGATNVSLPKHIAQPMGLTEGAREYANTANGVVETRATLLDSLTLGNITLRNVRASINPGMQGDEILLGMSALKNVEFTQRDGTLTLRQYY